MPVACRDISAHANPVFPAILLKTFIANKYVIIECVGDSLQLLISNFYYIINSSK
jgi:hypothetical protein